MLMRKVLVVLTILMTLPALLWAGGEAEERGGEVQGMLEYTEGKVTVNGSPGELGMQVPEGAWIETGAAGRCDIVFTGNNVIRVFPDSRVKIDIPGGKAELERGALGAVFKRLQTLLADGSRFELTSPTVAAGVRGTVFYLRSPNPGETYFCTCNGRVDLRDPEGGHLHETANPAHGALWYRRVEGEYRVEADGLRFHDNALMNSIAGRVDTEIPWGELPE
jgi:catechol 2,3-dioxygenase-like lactoylglutathione lyase family enzyme